MATLPLACDLPRDPRGTLERARDGTLRVAVSEHDPWVKKTNGEPGGVEPDLVRAFAETIRARVEWRWGMIDSELASLERYELDVVIGGLVETSPWKPKVGFTRPYYEERVVIAVPPGQTAPDELDGVEVGCELGTVTAHRLRREEARLLPLDEARRSGKPIAVPAWQARAWGLAPTEHLIHEEAHVMAVAPGENALLVALERFILGQRAIGARLERELSA